MRATGTLGQVSLPAILLLVAVALAAIAVYAPLMALATAVALVAVTLVARDSDNIILLGLVALPFTNSLLLANNLLGVPGLKPVNLVLAAALAIGLLKGGLFRSSDRIEFRAKLILLAYFLLFTIEFARSLPNLDLFRSLLPTQFEAEPIRYILSFYVKNALLLVPFIFIVTFMKNETDRVLFGLSAAIFALSCVIVLLVAQEPGVLGGGRNGIEALCERYLGFHYNTVGTIYLTVGPLLVYMARTRSLFGIANLVLAVVVILVLQSRSALVVFVLTSAVTLILIRRTALLVAGFVGVWLASGFWLGPTVTAALSVGIDQGSVYSLNDLFTGRVTYLWVPLFNEWIADPMLFLFGAGRYGILTTPLWANGQIIRAMHAHNAFLDFFLDSGAVLALLLIGAIGAWLLWSYRLGRRLGDPLYWALFMCVVAYLIGTLTERQFFPTVDNMLLFPILAVWVNVVRSHLAPERAPRPAAAVARPSTAARAGTGRGRSVPA